MSSQYSLENILFLHKCKVEGYTWVEIETKYNKKFNTVKTMTALEHAYNRYGHRIPTDGSDESIETLKKTARAKKSLTLISKENDVLVNNFIKQDDLLLAVQDYVNNSKPTKVTLRKRKKTNKSSIFFELILSDLHYGALTEAFNHQVARERMKEVCNELIKQLYNHEDKYNVDFINLCLLGDIIQNDSMHGIESLLGCEMSNPEQVLLAFQSIYEDIILPISTLNIPINVICVTGNHDRTRQAKSYHLQGRTNNTFTIYKTLEYLAKRDNLDHLNFIIPDDNFVIFEKNKTIFLYEHGDELKSLSENSIKSHVIRRGLQNKVVVDYFRFGHFHTFTSLQNGSFMCNGSLIGQDSYAKTKGYDTKAMQILNTFKLDKKASLYKTILIKLEE